MTTKIDSERSRKSAALFFALILGFLVGTSTTLLRAQTSALEFAGLRSGASQGQFNAVRADSIGNLYLLYDQHDGIRVLKTDPTASTVLGELHVGARGDVARALSLDPSGNVYIAGTTSSGALAGTAGAAFPTPSGNATSFVARLTPALGLQWLSFTGSDRMAVNALAVNSSGVFVTGSVFSGNLPVTPSAIFQAPSSGSLQNGFVERFDLLGSNLLFATYLTGASGDTAPAGLTVDNSGSAYIAGYTTASGYPTTNALVPNIIPNISGATSGFLTKLTSSGDGLVFSTFIPGNGISSIALDSYTGTLLMTGNVLIGAFPVATVQAPLISASYQSLLRISLDGSTVLSSTLLSPGNQSFVTPSSLGTAWIAGDLTVPLLAVPPVANLGNVYAAHVSAQNLIDQTARFGGLPTANPNFASVPVILNGLTTDSLNQPTFAGSVTPQASISLIPTQRYDLPTLRASTTALPSVLRDAVPAASSCILSNCPGSAGFLAKLISATTPGLAISYDNAPNLIVRNLGSASAHSLTLSSSDFTWATDCSSDLAPGAECNIGLIGSGPGIITLQASNAPSQTISIPLITSTRLPNVVSPKELDFGIQTSSSGAATRTLTITNLSGQPQTFTSALNPSSQTQAYSIAESASDCTPTGPTTKLLATGASCHVTLSLNASASSPNDSFVNTHWRIGDEEVVLTGYTQAAATGLSSAQVDFGTQYAAGIALARFLYLSNNSDTPTVHTPIGNLSNFKIQDRCPNQVPARSVCQLQIDYVPAHTPSNDSSLLSLDQGLSVMLVGQSLPQPGTIGATVNPNLTVSPAALTFPNSAVVTTTSSATQTVTIGNVGASAFPLSLSVSGDFSEVTDCPSILLAHTTCSALLSFNPSQPGMRQGLLSVIAGASSSPVYVNLSGTGAPILAANNGVLDFGSVAVGQPSVKWFKITQPFNSLTASTSSDFAAILVEDIGYGHGDFASNSFTANATGTCLNCWLGIQFRPSSVGPRTASIDLTSAATGLPYRVTLTGTGLPRTGLVLTPSAADFGTVPLHSASAPRLFTLTNLTSNAAPVTLSAANLSGDFLISSSSTGGPYCTGSLAPDSSCFLRVVFKPVSALGQASGALTLITSAGSVSSSLTAYSSADPGVALDPTAVTFENVPGLTSTFQNVTLRNTGTGPLQIATPVITNPSFAVTTTCATLAPASACTIAITFSPTNAIVTGTLTIPAASAAGTSLFAIPVTGAYTLADAGLQIIPSQADFGPASTGSLGLSRQFTINNLTAKSLSLNIAIPHNFALEGPPCAGLAPNASCSFSVAFLPLVNGNIAGTLFAQANSTDESSTLNAIGYVEGYGTGINTLSITGPLLPGRLLNFGQTVSGQSTIRVLTLTNTGGGPATTALSIRRITSQWPFLSTSNCGRTLALNASCEITVNYSPLNQLPTGTQSPLTSSDAGTLLIDSDALSGPDQITLVGTAASVLVTAPTNTAPLLSYTTSQQSLTFPVTPIGNSSIPQTVKLSNTGTTNVHVLSMNVEPDFATTNDCNTVFPGASCNLLVSFNPLALGTRIGALQISSDSSSSLDFISLLGAASPSLLALSPAAVDFGSLPLGSSNTLPLQITNTSSSPATFEGVTTSGDYTLSTGSCPINGDSLPTNSSCFLQITFKPTAPGSRLGVFSLATSIAPNPVTVNLSGVGTQPHLQINPTSLNFGKLNVGASALLSVTLTNTGNAPVTGVALSVSTGDYAVATPCSLTSLAPGAGCTATIAFAPTSTGPSSATLTVTSSDLSSPDQIALSGTGSATSYFSLTADGGPSSGKSTRSGQPVTYNLTASPINNYSGTVALTCAPVNPADFTTCSILPSTVILSGSPQDSVATLQTVSSVKLARSNPVSRSITTTALCMLPAALCLFWRRPRSGVLSATSLGGTWLFVAALAMLLAASGCGSGGDPSLRYSTPGTYQYRITASATTGIPITQSVLLDLTIQPR